MKKLSDAQRTALEHLVRGDGPGESWAQYKDDDSLAWYRHERTLDSLERNGWTKNGEPTEAGRAALQG